jgi:hypothetical protein
MPRHRGKKDEPPQCYCGKREKTPPSSLKNAKVQEVCWCWRRGLLHFLDQSQPLCKQPSSEGPYCLASLPPGGETPEFLFFQATVTSLHGLRGQDLLLPAAVGPENSLRLRYQFADTDLQCGKVSVAESREALPFKSCDLTSGRERELSGVWICERVGTGHKWWDQGITQCT